MNKAGGVAWVLAVHEDILDTLHPDGITRTYDLRYVIDSKCDYNVSEEFVEPHEYLVSTSRKRGLIPENDNSTMMRSAEKKLKQPKREVFKKERISKDCSLQGQSETSKSHNIFILATSLDHADFPKLEEFISIFSSHANASTSSLSTGSTTSSSSSSSSLRHFSDKIVLDATASASLIILSEKFDENVTHVVVSVDKFDVLKTRTLKFMQAIMG